MVVETANCRLSGPYGKELKSLIMVPVSTILVKNLSVSIKPPIIQDL